MLCHPRLVMFLVEYVSTMFNKSVTYSSTSLSYVLTVIVAVRNALETLYEVYNIVRVAVQLLSNVAGIACIGIKVTVLAPSCICVQVMQFLPQFRIIPHGATVQLRFSLARTRSSLRYFITYMFTFVASVSQVFK